MSDKDISQYIDGKVIMVTGGTGSFGNAVVDRLLKYSPKQIVVVSRDEKKQFDMANKYQLPNKLRLIIADVRDKDRITSIIKGVDLIFHAAALKQVPQCEFFPSEAILTNAIGANNVITAAVHHNVQRMVVLSTDKAVHPINVMGMTKALMERLMIAQSREKRSDTILCGTRYGNVMYTRGSVIPYFIERMKNGKTLTVTNKDMTRFMMSLEDSVDLVLFAMASGNNGSIYVKKAPAATVGDLAKAMADLFGYKGEIEEIGTRPGEKVHEILVSPEEAFRAYDEGDYFRIDAEVPNMDVSQYYSKGENKNNGISPEGYTSNNTRRLSVEEIKKLLLTLPEVRSELESFKK